MLVRFFWRKRGEELCISIMIKALLEGSIRMGDLPESSFVLIDIPEEEALRVRSMPFEEPVKKL